MCMHMDNFTVYVVTTSMYGLCLYLGGGTMLLKGDEESAKGLEN